MPRCHIGNQTAPVITNVIIHLINDLPVVADVEALPTGGDRSLRCTNVRTLDGKRPQFVQDPHATFIFPLSVLRMIEAPVEASAFSEEYHEQEVVVTLDRPPQIDEEPDEDLLARIRSV